ncbi:hypothetical protein JIN85_06535 [Luteolibacter pohnpeiensis]|uniref:Uncharacterized protein n=1 Tax=Luteolibacter pohnpeiensis TaxID=454153 RepID=A0A934VW19_9BACT|nr:hypothetical protein [Luteolibacter pohnpeiensis]MBK1882064.1 hypothetical protein [Luteolibacter pohnpeiensis]
MKVFWAIAVFSMATARIALAQVEIPSNPLVKPPRPATRTTHDGTESDTKLELNRNDGKVRTVTYVVLYDTRIWTSSEGKPLEAKLIAFEDLVIESKSLDSGKAPTPPSKPTVVKNGKARFLVHNKPVEIALDRLSAQDQELIAGIKAAIEKKAATASAADGK